MKARDPIDYARAKLRRETTFSPLVLVNLAGRHLTTMHEWQWLKRSTTFSLVASQNYVALPADFDSLIAMMGQDGLQQITPTTEQEILFYRQNSGLGAGTFRAAIGYRDLGAADPSPVIELDQEPTANETDWGQIYYFSGWQDITSEEDEVEMPRWMEPLFYLLFDQWLFGSEEHDVAPLTGRLDAIRTGSVYRDARRKDDSLQESFGPIVGGAARRSRLVDITALTNFSVLDPA